MDRFLAFLNRGYLRPKTGVLVSLVLVVFLGWGLGQLRFDTDVRTMMPQGNTDVAVNDYYDSPEVFGDSNLIFIGVESADAYGCGSLEYLRRLQVEIEALNHDLPPVQLAEALGIPGDEGQNLRLALGNLGWNPQTAQAKLQDFFPAAGPRAARLGLKVSTLGALEKWLNRHTAADLYRLWQNPVDSVTSLANADDIVNEDDTLLVRKLLPDGPLGAQTPALLKARVARWSFYQGTLVSADGKLATVLVKLSNSDKRVQSGVDLAVKKILAQGVPPGIHTYLDGESVIGDLIGEYIFADMKLLLPLVVLAVLLVLFLCFRRWEGVVYPSLVILVTAVSALGFMAWVQVPLNVVSVAMPVLLVALSGAYAVHQMNHYLLDPDPDRQKVLGRNLQTVGLAVTLSGLTVMVGFGSLVVEKFQPIRNFGLFTAAGDLMAVLAALVTLPALLLALGHRGRPPVRDPHLERAEKGMTGRLLQALVRLTEKYPGPLVVTALVLTLFFALGVFQVRSELNNVSFFRPDSPIRVADELLNEKLAGTQVLNIILDSDLSPVESRTGREGGSPAVRSVTDLAVPGVLNRVEDFTRLVREKFPVVRKSLSFNDILKKMNQEMRGGSPADYTIPQDPALVSQYLLVYSGDLSGVLTPDHGKLRITLTLQRAPDALVEQVRAFALDYFGGEFAKTWKLQPVVTGTAHLYHVANELLVRGNIESLAVCLTVVFLLLWAVLRNPFMTLVSLVPIFFTLAVNFGILGWLSIPLNVGTSMVSSIAIGIGVDYSIHYITWYRSERRQGHPVTQAVNLAIVRKGRAILYNMLVITAGFLVLSASQFVPLVQFGTLVALCMVTTALGSLVLVPGLIRLLDRRGSRFLHLK